MHHHHQQRQQQQPVPSAHRAKMTGRRCAAAGLCEVGREAVSFLHCCRDRVPRHTVPHWPSSSLKHDNRKQGKQRNQASGIRNAEKCQGRYNDLEPDRGKTRQDKTQNTNLKRRKLEDRVMEGEREERSTTP